jgi:4-carboxymuconolactone decarboxylase
LTHYLGFPLGSKLDGVITKVTQQRKKQQGEDKKANVNAAVRMHSGSKVHDQ